MPADDLKSTAVAKKKKKKKKKKRKAGGFAATQYNPTGKWVDQVKPFNEEDFDAG